MARNAISNFYNIFNNLVKLSNEIDVSKLIREVIKLTNYEEYICD
jgi:superfamily I DNA/RNA helicase